MLRTEEMEQKNKIEEKENEKIKQINDYEMR